jgi:uncharacterized protein YdaU (DUF1376 family)
MNGLPYYKAYPRDFIEGTIGMDFETKAAYRLVLDLIYMQGGALPDDPRYISGLLGCSVKKWKSLRETLVSAGKIEVRGDVIGNNRADKELETLGKFQDKQRENRARPNKNKAVKSPPINHTEPDTDTERDKSLSNARERADDRFEEAWKAYQACPLKAQQTKKLAKGQWPKAVKRAGGADPILKAIAAEVAKRSRSEDFVPNLPDMHRWLSQDRWDDALQSAKAETSSSEISEESWRRMLLRFHDSAAWPDYAGPKPNELGCLVPEQILSRYLEWAREQAKQGEAA